MVERLIRYHFNSFLRPNSLRLRPIQYLKRHEKAPK